MIAHVTFVRPEPGDSRAADAMTRLALASVRP
jgi:hypothetical protein